MSAKRNAKEVDANWSDICRSIMSALSRMDGDGLRAHTVFMRARKSEFQVSKIISLNTGDRSTWDNGVKVKAHPLCVLLERVKLCTDEAKVGMAYDAVGAVVGDWGINPNMVFTAEESRPLHTRRAYNPIVLFNMMGPAERFAEYTIVSTPLSWLIYLRHGDTRGEVNARAGMRRLLEQRADPNVPFHLVIQGPPAATAVWRQHDAESNARHGRSLLSAAMESDWGVECVELLLEFGARFLAARDPQPLCNAIAVYGAEVAVPLFHRYWLAGQVTRHDVLSHDTEDEDGSTAMHMLARCPPLDDTTTNMMFEMGFTPHTTNRKGATVLQCAETPQRFLTDEMRESKEKFVNELHGHDRVMAMAAHKVLHGLPRDVREHIGDSIPYGSKLQWAAKADDRRRQAIR